MDSGNFCKQTAQLEVTEILFFSHAIVKGGLMQTSDVLYQASYHMISPLFKPCVLTRTYYFRTERLTRLTIFNSRFSPRFQPRVFTPTDNYRTERPAR